jgi:hypothetical protein
VSVNGTNGDDNINVAGNGLGAGHHRPRGRGVGRARRPDRRSVRQHPRGNDNVLTSGVFGTQVFVNGAAV